MIRLVPMSHLVSTCVQANSDSDYPTPRWLLHYDYFKSLGESTRLQTQWPDSVKTKELDKFTHKSTWIQIGFPATKCLTCLWRGENWCVYNKPNTTILQEIGQHTHIQLGGSIAVDALSCCLVSLISSQMEEVDVLSTISRWKQGRL